MSEYLKSLKKREETAYRNKKEAGRLYGKAKKAAAEAFIAKQKAADQRRQAKEELNKQYQAMMEARDGNRAVWDEYHLVCSYIGDSIDDIREKADAAHRAMVECFKNASAEYERGNKLAARMLSIEGYEHRDRRNTLNMEVKELYEEINRARRQAEDNTPGGSEVFHAARLAYDRASQIHRAASDKFKSAKDERERLRDEFYAAKAAHIAIKTELQRRTAEEAAAECNHASSKAK